MFYSVKKGSKTPVINICKLLCTDQYIGQCILDHYNNGYYVLDMESLTSTYFEK